MNYINDGVVDGAGVIVEPGKQEIVRDDLGRFVKGAPSPNPKGLRKGTVTFPKILEDLMSVDNLDDIDETTLTVKEQLCLGWIRQAKDDGSLKALEMLVNRLEGTPVATQKIDVTANKSPFDAFRDDQSGQNS